MNYTIFMPCAGKSSRYPNVRPKFLLVNPNGNLMLFDAISKIDTKDARIVVTILREHEEKYKIQKMMNDFFSDRNIELCILENQTKSQSETVYQTIKQLDIKSPFLVKDSDNIFELTTPAENYNYIAVEKLDKVGLINAANKSYVQYDESGLVTNIEEKKVISDTFSVGGYYFTDPSDFVSAFEEINTVETDKEIYISTVISYLILKYNAKFKTKTVSDYVDLGTIKEWIQYKNKAKTYFVDIDGVLVENGAEYWEPFWGETAGIRENIEIINKLYDEGNEIILTTSRKEAYREKTEEQLKREGLRYHRILMGLYHSPRVVVNDFSNSNPYPSARAINIPRNSNELDTFIGS